MNRERRLNVAYGSNLNLEQMARRCPTANVYGKGMLKGYQLLFKGASQNAYATIKTCQNGKVPVLVWELQQEDEKALDYYEGFPRFYYKENVVVKLESGEHIMAMVYIMTDKMKDRIHLNFPSRRYVDIVTAGYLEAGFDTAFIEDALEVSKKAIRKRKK